MTKGVREHHKEQQNKNEFTGSQRKGAVVVGLVCVGIIAAVVGMNCDRLFADSDVPESTEKPIGATAASNTAPVIVSITPAVDRIEPSDVTRIVCEAKDADADALAYAWVVSQGTIGGEGASVEWTAPATEGLYNLSVRVDDGRGGMAEYSASLRVKANGAPEIVSLSSASDWSRPETSTYVSCVAADPDGDKIAYEWSATAGQVFGQGASVVWVAPAATGAYQVAVAVHDAYGGESRRAIPISVTPGQAPTLVEFVVKGIDTDLLKQYGDVWEIFRGRSCSIECVVLEGEAPFTFTWSADAGTLTADGATARWDAPDGKSSPTITVDVTDVHGNATRGVVLMSVETCTCKFK